MSLFSSIGKVFKGAVKGLAGSALGKLAVSAIPGVGPIAGAVIGTAASLGASALTSRSKAVSLPVLPGGGGRMLPPIGRAIATAAPYAAGAAAGIIWDQPEKKKRRRRKGISARDLSSFKRVARLVDKFSKPVHHFRNFKKGQ